MIGSGNEVDQLLVTIQDALDATGVYVAPSLRAEVSDRDVAAIEAAVARSPEPLFVVAQPLTYDDAFGGDAGDLLSRLHDASGQPGVYVAGVPAFTGGEFELEARIWEDALGASTTETYAVSAVGEAQGRDDLGAQLVAVTEAIADGTLQEQYDAIAGSGSTGTGAPASDDAAATPYVVGGGIALALVLVWALARRRPSRSPGTLTPDAQFDLPPSVIERVRDAHDAQLTRRAHDDVLALGERIDAAELTADGAGDASRSWQATLDHYEAARRVLGEGDAVVDVLDVVGAIVLAERGVEALEAATSGRAFVPTTRCFLDPLHGAATTEGSLDLPGGRGTVPLCARCRSDLRKKLRPDILDVVRDGEAVHYFETDDEPWASTGFGSLETDLVARLHRRR